MPHRPGDTDSLAGLLADAMNARTEQVNTCLPGIVLSYDVTKQTASVRPAVQRPMTTEDGAPMAEQLPDFLACPVIFPRAGGYMLHVPLKEGDSVLLLFPQWNISEWRRRGGAHVESGDARHHSLGSAVCIAGLFPSDAPVAGLSATECLLGTPDKFQVRFTATKLYVGDARNPMRPIARVNDHVQVTIPAGAVIVGVTGGGGSPAVGEPNAAPIVCNGIVTSGSTTIEGSD